MYMYMYDYLNNACTMLYYHYDWYLLSHTFVQLLDGQEVSISAVSSPELFYVQLAEHQQQ